MKTRIPMLSVLALIVASTPAATPLAAAQLGTGFTYQGQLKQDGVPFDGTGDFEFTLWDAAGSGNPPTGGTQVGGVQAINALPVTAGLFTVTLNAAGEFGGNAFNGNARWVQIAVRSPAGIGAFTTLAPRQPLTAAPYALQTRGLIVDAENSLGVGAAPPGGVRLFLQGTTALDSAAIKSDRGPNYSHVHFGPSGDWYIRSAAANGKVILQDAGGNVGIGTASPQGRLDVVGVDSSYMRMDNTYGDLHFNGGSDGVLGIFNEGAPSGRTTFVAQGAERLVITNAGNVGIGTTTPTARLAVRGNGTDVLIGDAGCGPPTAAIGFGTMSGCTNFAIGGNVDAGADAGTFINRPAGRSLHFRENNGPDQMTIAPGGNVGIGQTFPTYKLDVQTGANTGIRGWSSQASGIAFGGFFQADSTSGRGVYGEASDSTGTNYGGYFKTNSGDGFAVYGLNTAYGGAAIYGESTAQDYGTGLYGKADSTSGIGVIGNAAAASGVTYGGQFESHSTNGTGVFGWATADSGVNHGVVGRSNSTDGFDFYAAGAGIDYGSSSSIRSKSNVRNIDQPLQKVARLRGVYFDWDAAHGGRHGLGMIAEEVGQVLPEIVGYEENGIDATGMDYSKLTPLLVEAVKDQQQQIDALRQENAELLKRLEALEARRR